MTESIELLAALDQALHEALVGHLQLRQHTALLETTMQSAQTLQAQQTTTVPHAAQVRLALSGGLDSVLLLHRLVHSPLPMALEAMHVNHGLQAAATEFAEFCEQLCRQWRVNFHLAQVQISDATRNIEAQARQARYQALSRDLAAGSLLLTGHHADDQVETLLLALKRGAGLAGLAGIAAEKPCGQGLLLRPWLGFSRAELAQVATFLQLSWVEDPSNHDCSFDRNFLRQQIMPLLHQRFAHFSKTAARSVAHLQHAYQQERVYIAQQLSALQDVSAQQRWQALGADLCEPPLRLDALQQHPQQVQLSLLKHWLAPYQPLLELPQLQDLWLQLTTSRIDAKPQINFGDLRLRRYNDYLLLSKARPADVPVTPTQCMSVADLRLGISFAGFHLKLTEQPPQAPWHGLPCPAATQYWFSVGELNRRLTPSGRGVSKALKDLCKEQQVPPWLRQQLPVMSLSSESRDVCWMLGVGSAVPEQTGLWLCWQPLAQSV